MSVVNNGKPETIGRFRAWKKRLDKRLSKKYNMEDRSGFLFCYLMLLLPFITFLVFWLYVNIDSILLAFKMNDRFTMENFRNVWTAIVDEDGWGYHLPDILKRTFIVWLVTQATLIPSMLSTYILYKKLPGHYVFRTIYMIPGTLGGVILSMIYKHFVGANGPLVTLLQNMGVHLSDEIVLKGFLGSSKTAFTTLNLMIFIPGIFSFSFIISGAFARIPEELYEVGKLEGIGFIKEFFVVALPLVWGTLIIIVIGALAGILTTDNGSFIYTKGQYDTACMGYYLFILQKQISDTNGDTSLLGYPAAIGLTLTLITLPIVLITRTIMEKVNDVAY